MPIQDTVLIRDTILIYMQLLGDVFNFRFLCRSPIVTILLLRVLQ